MIIQYASDLHLEFRDNAVLLARNPFRAVGDIMVLAGDTLPLIDLSGYEKHCFFDWCSEHFRETYLIPGNHEYYRDDVMAYPASWEHKLRDNVTLCENRSYVLDDTEIILSTLWSHIPESAYSALMAGMNDFHLIHAGKDILAPGDYNALHKRDLAFLKDAVASSKAAHKVVVTHHVPSRLLVAPEFRNSSLESGFTVDLTEYIEASDIDLWVYGHSHRSIERKIGGTFLASNQMGYVAGGEYRNNFTGDKAVDLDLL